MTAICPRVLCLTVIGLAACAPATQQSPPVVVPVYAPINSVQFARNPFAGPSTLPYEAPDFTKIRDTDYAPAYEAGMKQQAAEINAIANQTDAPSFDNTIVALEKSGALLTRVAKTFNAVTGANTNPVLQKIQEDLAPKLAAHGDAIFLDDKLYQRVKSVYDRRNALGLTSEQNRLVELYNRNFVRAGANLSDTDKGKLRALNQEEAKLTTDFQNRLLAATKAGALVIDKVSDLEGMSADAIASAAAAAKQRGLEGKWVIQLQNTTQHPAQPSLKNRAVRERLFIASTTRTSKGDTNDTRDIVKRLAQLRGEKATLLGFANWSAYALDNQMAKTPVNATKLLTDLAPAATARARAEIATMQAMIDKENGGFKLAPWDWQYYAERVRQQQYDLDEDQIKPYFEANRVLVDGVFFAATQLYGLTFKERKDIPVYHPDVRVYEVFDASGKAISLYYSDWFKRDEKNGGAWMDTFVDQNGITGTKPVVFNVGNFAKAAAGKPSLLTSDEVTTMFHEFGHSLHGMLSKTNYPTVSGTNTPRDFVEFPSQINEHWAFDPIVLANYAKHYQTGAPMPAELVAKIKKAATFNQGFATTEYLAASLLDIAWHSIPPGSPQQDVDAFEAEALRKANIAMAEVPPRYRTSYFSHIWPGGYSSSYYAYLWSEVLDHDTFAWFNENGGLTRANGQRFADMLLSKGGTMDPAEMYRAFRGRDPNVEYLIIGRGLKEAPPAK